MGTVVNCDIRPERLFLIISPARCASTSLRKTLDELPQIACHGELFGKLKIGKERLSNKITAPDMGVYHRNIRAENFLCHMFPNNKYIFGSKWLYPHFFSNDNLQFIDAFSKKKPNIVFLWRRNLVRRYMSEIILRFKKGYIKLHNLAEINLNTARQDCEKQILQAHYIKKIISPANILSIDFEDMITHRSVTTKIIKFLTQDDSVSKEITLKDKESNISYDKKDGLKEFEYKFNSFSKSLEEYCDFSNPILSHSFKK